MLKSLSALSAATLLGLVAAGISAVPSNAKSSATRLRCDAVGASDAHIGATYDQHVNKKKRRKNLAVDLEAPPPGGFVAGSPVVFTAHTVPVGTFPLA